ncbi:sensor histidine kinase [Polaribacter uvawellassae]|uniref:sensor histidine kinase n=1 Tax=Polaribacter uvawellassae TaxID=3133495 RepID=UPI00321B23DC
MKISKQIFLVFFFLSGFNLSYSQTNFKVEENFKTVKFDQFIHIHKTELDTNANDLINDNAIKWEENKTSYGFSKAFYWLKFSIENTSTLKKELYFEVNNPHIKYIEFYESKEEEYQLKYYCGDYMPFDSRPIDNEKFIFPIVLNPNQKSSFLIRIDKRNTSVSFPTYLWDKDEFIKNSNKYKLVRGIFYGGFVICFLFSFVSFFFLRKQIYLWYSLYILASSLYLFTTMGYSFQYLYPNTVIFTSFFRMTTLVFGALFLLKFTQSLLKTKEYATKTHLLMDFCVYAFLFLLAVWLIFPEFFQSQITLMIKTLYILLFISLMSYFLAALITYSKQKEVARLYLASFGVLFLCGAFSLLLEYGWYSELRTYISLLFIGTLLEVVILGISLLNDVRLTYQAKSDLTLKVAEKQKEITEAFIDGMEKEKVIISNELHDDIGSRMANFLRQIDHDKKLSDTSREKLISIIDDVRKISHRLTPKKSSLLSFEERLTNLVEEAFYESGITYDFQFIGNKNFLDEKEELNVYRILQEILHNILKHAKANSVEIQFVNFDNEITITIEDDGVGFNSSKRKKGLGIYNIQKRVAYLNGTIEISSIKNKGTFIVIVIPNIQKKEI